MYCLWTFLVRTDWTPRQQRGKTWSAHKIAAVMAHRRGIPPRTHWGRPSVVLQAFAAASKPPYPMRPQRQFAAAISPVTTCARGQVGNRCGGGRRWRKRERICPVPPSPGLPARHRLIPARVTYIKGRAKSLRNSISIEIQSVEIFGWFLAALVPAPAGSCIIRSDKQGAGICAANHWS